MRVDLILCDAAQSDSSGAKVHMLGAGWNIAFVAPGQSLSPHSVVAFFHVPWNDANQVQPVEFTLVDEDEAPVRVAQVTGELVPLQVTADVEVGRPPGSRPGSKLVASLAFNVGPGLPLFPDRGYAWVCRVKGEEVARAVFQAAAAPSGPPPVIPS